MGKLDADVQDIRGIGPTYRALLSERGVETLEHMLWLRPPQIASATGVTIATATAWWQAADLQRLTDVDFELAEKLAEGGLGDLEALASAGLTSLRSALGGDDGLSDPALVRLQQAASALGDRASLVGYVFSRTTGRAISGMRVTTRGGFTRTDDNGRFEILSIPSGDIMIHFEHKDTYQFSRFPLTVPRGKLARKQIFRVQPRLGVDLTDSVREGRDGLLSSSDKLVTREIDIAMGEAAAASPFIVSNIKRDGTIQLVSLRRLRRGEIVFTERLDVPPSSLASGVDVGAIIEWTDGTLTLTTKTLREACRDKADWLDPAAEYETVRIHMTGDSGLLTRGATR